MSPRDCPPSRLKRLADMPLVDDGAPPAGDWVFCLGFARNGTTALTRVVSYHPRAVLLNEVWLWGYASVFRTSEFHFGAEDEVRIANERLHALRGGPGRVCTASEVREFMEGMRKAVAPEAAVFGDKRGEYLVHLSDLIRVFPGCKLMLSLRNVWDRAALRFEPKDPKVQPIEVTPELALRAYQASCRDHDRIQQIMQQCPGHEFLIAHFDDFVVRPEEAIIEVLDFLGLEATGYDWSVLDTLHHSYANERWRAFPALAALRESITGDGREGGGCVGH